MKTYFNFCRIEDGNPVLRDNSPLVIGKWYETDKDIELCSWGFHASEKPLDALYYAPGPYCSIVQLDGEIIEGYDKIVASRRRALVGFDATDILLAFARKCAFSAINLWNVPQIVKDYLESGDEKLRTAAYNAFLDDCYNTARDPFLKRLLDSLITGSITPTWAAWASSRCAAVARVHEEQDKTITSKLMNKAHELGFKENR